MPNWGSGPSWLHIGARGVPAASLPLQPTHQLALCRCPLSVVSQVLCRQSLFQTARHLNTPDAAALYTAPPAPAPLYQPVTSRSQTAAGPSLPSCFLPC